LTRGEFTKSSRPYEAAAQPEFDVTPHGLVTALITERGIVEPPFEENLRRVMQGKPPAHRDPHGPL
jgi:methylthioribose-1-phosphate isomerase